MSTHNKKLKVAYITKAILSDGITNVILNYACHLDRSKVQPTIISGPPILEFQKDKFLENGIDVKEVPAKKDSPMKYYYELWKILREGQFDIVHIHGNSATITIELVIAKLSGIRTRIAHCHSSSCDYMKAHKLLLPLFKHMYTKGYACSELAGKWLFGDSSYQVLINGFETNKFVFDQNIRNSIRKDLDIEDKFVIGNVARFNPGKNHKYLLKAFEEIASRKENAVLLLIGEGIQLGEILQLVNSHPYKDRIIYYGVTDHVENLYNAMDVFVLPSKHEGFGLVLVEAQINGLKCVTSDRVPREVNINNQTVFLSLEDNLEQWVSESLKVSMGDRKDRSELAYSSARKFDIEDNAKKLEKDYFELTELV